MTLSLTVTYHKLLLLTWLSGSKVFSGSKKLVSSFWPFSGSNVLIQSLSSSLASYLV
ncbi:hypothetical protein A2U01_0003844 [Trifolium medium]|uniref:Uncharacterized protein n=1 Tax=Trifolium medium TaxID=97028 RepID=A0A392M6H2_9FABA|nr:hypothetical protein [Trifolium medium]